MDLGLYRSISAGLPDSPSAAAFAQPSQTVNAEVMQQLSRSSEPPAGSLAARHVLEASGCKLADSSLIDGCSSFYAATSSHDQPATKQKAAGAAAAQQHNHHLATGFVTGTLHLPCSAETVTRLRGPVLQISRADDSSLDMRIYHSFRANFAGDDLQRALTWDKGLFAGLEQQFGQMSCMLEEIGMSTASETDRSSTAPSGQELSADCQATSSCSSQYRKPSRLGRCSSSPDLVTGSSRSGSSSCSFSTRGSSRLQHMQRGDSSRPPSFELSVEEYRQQPAKLTALSPFADEADASGSRAAAEDETLEPAIAGLTPKRTSFEDSSLGFASDSTTSSAVSGTSMKEKALSQNALAARRPRALSPAGSTISMRSAIVHNSVVEGVQNAKCQLAHVSGRTGAGQAPVTEEQIDQKSRRLSLSDDAHSHLQSWILDPSTVIMGERIAVGGYAEVFIGKMKGTVIAVKLLLMHDDITTERVLTEVAALAGLRHPNLILFMGFCMQPRPAIICEFMQRGSLFKVLRKQNGPLEGRLSRSITIAIARAMAYLHGRVPAILHLDLKSPNILLDDRWHCKITDFGLSRELEHTLLSRGAAGGTPEWMAPEMLRCEPFDERADVYSFGVCMYEMLTGAIPWQGLHAMQVVGTVGFARQSLPVPQSSETFLVELCMKCMKQDPAERPYFPIWQRVRSGEYTIPDHPRVSDECKDLIRALMMPEPCKRATISDVLGHSFFLKDLPAGALDLNAYCCAAQDSPEGQAHALDRDLQMQSVCEQACLALPALLPRQEHNPVNTHATCTATGGTEDAVLHVACC